MTSMNSTTMTTKMISSIASPSRDWLFARSAGPDRTWVVDSRRLLRIPTANGDPPPPGDAWESDVPLQDSVSGYSSPSRAASAVARSDCGQDSHSAHGPAAVAM